MSSPTGIWTGWNNAGFCSFFTKKEAEIPNKNAPAYGKQVLFIAGGGVLDAPRAVASIRPYITWCLVLLFCIRCRLGRCVQGVRIGEIVDDIAAIVVHLGAVTVLD